MPAQIFLRRAGLAADDIAGSRRELGVAVFDDETHQFAHLRRGLFRDDPLTWWLDAGRYFEHGRGVQGSPIDDCRNRGRDMQRTDRDAVAVSDGDEVFFSPPLPAVVGSGGRF